MPGAPVPDSVMMAVDDWVTVVDKAIQMVGEDHVALGTDFDGGPLWLVACAMSATFR